MPSSSIEILPVIHSRDGHLVGPDAEPIDEDLKSVARRFSREYDGLYLVDLEGLHGNRPDVTLLQQIADRVHVWADSGPRSPEDVIDMLMAGAQQVTLRHHTADGPETIREAVRVTENVALGLEFEAQKLVENRSWPTTPPELVSLAEELHIPIVVVDHSRAGTATGIDRSVAWHARQHEPGAFFAGGVASNRDLDVLEDLGYQGALVSTALLEGKNLEGQDWSGPSGMRDEADRDESGDRGGPDLQGGVF